MIRYFGFWETIPQMSSTLLIASYKKVYGHQHDLLVLIIHLAHSVKVRPARFLHCKVPIFSFSYSVYQHNSRFRVQSPSGSDHFSAGHLDPWPPVKLPGLYHWPLYSFLITASRPFKHKLDHIPALSKTHWDYS